MLGGGVGWERFFDQMSKEPAYGKPHAGWRKNSTYIHFREAIVAKCPSDKVDFIVQLRLRAYH